MSERLTAISETCPYCHADLRGPKIPEGYRHPASSQEYYSRVIGVYDMDLDITVSFRCPDCGKEDRRNLEGK